MINKKWDKILSKIDFAFQPIANIKSGRTYGVEIFLRDFKIAGEFYSIANFFDEAYNDGVLYKVDLEIRLLVLKKFKNIDIQNLRLFYNLDYRILNMPDFTAGNTSEIFDALKLDTNLIYFEISETSSLKDPNAIRNLSTRYKQEGYNVVLDNFATGISGFQLLYYPNCDFIKLDRMFIDNIGKDIKKRLFFSSIINMAHIMNIKVIASCVETIEEYYVCKDLGVDFIQGFFVQKPTKEYQKITTNYKHIKELYKNDKRNDSANSITKDKIKKIDSLGVNSTLEELFGYFKENPTNHFAPIVDSTNSLLGVVYEKDIKKLSYSPFGMSLAKNASMDASIEKYMKGVISAEITWSVDKVLDIYNTTAFDKTGVFITKNNEYFGFVDLNNLLELSYLRNVEIARDQNPLTKLPGNSQIESYLNTVFTNKNKNIYHIVYFDFNDFKPFNDLYGFRQGDRAILMFANILKRESSSDDFIAHIGGDDFFIGFKNKDYEIVYETINKIQQLFRNEAKELYSKEDQEKNHIETKDRFGISRKFKLLGICSAIVQITEKTNKNNFDLELGKIKKDSKKIDIPLCVAIL